MRPSRALRNEKASLQGGLFIFAPRMPALDRQELGQRGLVDGRLLRNSKRFERAGAALRELNETLERRIKEETQERLQIWNVCQDLLVITDLEGKFLKVNPAWTTTLGWHEFELLGKSSQWMLHPDDRKQALAETERLAAGRILHRFGVRFREKNGSYRWLSWRAVPYQGRIYAMARDETEQKHAEDRLREAQQELEQVSRQTTLGAMTGSIAHEINQPLSAIIAHGNAGLRWLARKDPNLDEAQKALQQIVGDGLRARLSSETKCNTPADLISAG